ncbi:ATP-binding protein [Solidesulfovibrio sp.]|uniref:sensor histidine kinase n=1 Tax=Solidesulfovibrio sp. TaxID=2910990 RepID=UPI00263208C0|nr:ATP-binding protein [Solidesulfovibrio sp.]
MKHRRIFSRPLSFRGSLLVVLASLGVVFSLLGATVIGLLSRSELERTTGDNLEDLAFQMADKFDRGMFERQREIVLLARRSVLRDPAVSTARKRAALEDAKATLPIHAWIAVVSPEGRVVAATGGVLEGQDISGRPWFQPGRKGPFVGDVHGGALLAGCLPAPADGNLRFVDVAAPLLSEDGRLVGVLCSHLTWEWAREVEESLFRDLKRGRDIELFVYSGAGEPLLVPAGSRPGQWPRLDVLSPGRRNAAGNAVLRWPDGEYVTGFAPEGGYRDYPGLGWTVLARQKTAVAFAPAQALLVRALFVGGAIGLLAVLHGLAASGRLTRPLASIGRAAEAIRRGDLGVRIPLLDSPAELAALSQSLGTLVAALLSKNQALSAVRASLEEKVRERTAALLNNQQLLLQTQRIGRIGGWTRNREGTSRQWTAEIFRLLRLPEGPTPDARVVGMLFAPSDQRLLEDAMEKAWRDGEAFDLNLQLADRGQGRRWLRVMGKRDVAQGPPALSGIVQDVTDQVLLEELHEDMDRIARHDLKSPLNGIVTLPQLMLEDPNLTDEQREYLKMIREAGVGMLDMINLSLALFRMEQGTYALSPRPVDMLEVLRRVLGDQTGLIRSKGLSVSVAFEGRPVDETTQGFALAEEILSYALLANLVKNALEAMPAGGTLHVNLSRRQDFYVALRNGGEVPAAIRDKVFQKYVTGGKQGGTGLGMYSARLMARTMGGDLLLDASESGHTTLRLRLPLPEVP